MMAAPRTMTLTIAADTTPLLEQQRDALRVMSDAYATAAAVISEELEARSLAEVDARLRDAARNPRADHEDDDRDDLRGEVAE